MSAPFRLTAGRLALLAAAGTALVGLAGTPQLTAAPARTPAAPAFTAAEAQAGADLYAGACAMCHGAALQGTYEVPPLTGRFVANWANAPVGNLHAYLRRAMPQFAPGTLSEHDATNLAAYLLHANGLTIRSAPGRPAKGPAEDPRLRALITLARTQHP